MEIKNIYVETYGCAANQNNSEIIAGLLSTHGLNIVSNKEIADLAILNTCIVKGPTEQRMKFRIKELYKEFKHNLVITGCMPDVKLQDISNIAPLASIIGSHYIHKIPSTIKKMTSGKKIEKAGIANEMKLCMPKIKQNKIIGITQILEGCTGNCSFCITKKAKGELFSYPESMIIKNIKYDIATGCKEIWLTSQDNAAYGLDKGEYKLVKLLNKITNIKGKFLIRIGMMNPNHVLNILEDLIQCYYSEKIFKFLHIPLQSGSDKILEDMNLSLIHI